MDNKVKRNQKLILNIIYFSFVFLLVYLFGIALKLEAIFPIQIFAVFIISMTVKIFLLNPLILYTLIAVSFLGAVLVNNYITPFIFDFLERTYHLFANILNNLRGIESIAEDNILLFWGILIILVSLFTSIVLFKGKNIKILLPVYLGFFLYYWYNFFDEAYWVIAVFLLAYLILMGLDKYMKENSGTNYNAKYDIEMLFSSWIKTVLLYSLLIVMISMILPKSYNTIHWPWLQQKVYNTFPFVEDLRSNNIYSRGREKANLFDFSITGFQQKSSKLGGPVVLDDKKIMTVYADSSTYLRGNVKQLYTGNAWEAISYPSRNYHLNQDFSNIPDEEKELFYKEVNVIIVNEDFSTTTIFSPYKPSIINSDIDSLIRVNRDSSLVFLEGVYDKESYYVRTQKPLPYGILVALGANYSKDDIDDLDIYLQIPQDKITTRTIDLVKRITAEAKNDFEKAVVIENYLRNNFEYNLYVNEVPENYEFVDYFLFEGKEGYCTYYATSMAVMLRIAGIPSRYIEGFIAEDSIETGIYEVKNKNAHTWVEAFIEPVGWMNFEPTPAYPIELRLEDYKPIVEENNSNQAVDNGSSEFPRNNNDGLEIELDDDLFPDDWVPDIGIPQENVSDGFSRNIIIVIAGILLSIIPVRFILGLLQYKYHEFKAKKLPVNERIIYLYKQIHRIIELLGYPQQSGETHYEYARRISYKFWNDGEKGIQEITEIFVRSKYSNIVATNDDILNLKNYKESLEGRLKEHLGRRGYYYNKYVKKRFGM